MAGAFLDYRDDRFEWDRVKAASNLRDHGVSFGDARLAFDDPRQFDEYLPDDSEDEERSKLVGMSRDRVLTVIFTEREGDDGLTRIRIISAWKANKHDQAPYNAG